MPDYLLMNCDEEATYEDSFTAEDSWAVTADNPNDAIKTAMKEGFDADDAAVMVVELKFVGICKREFSLVTPGATTKTPAKRKGK